MDTTPKLSIVVLMYNMERAIKRTLYSLSLDHQIRVSSDDYEVIVIDNGSDTPLDQAFISSLNGNFSYHYISNAHPALAKAINYGLSLCKGQMWALMVDGARIATPGIIYATLRAASDFKSPVVTAISWLLGSKIQSVAIVNGEYDEKIEDALLESIQWPSDGYKLYDISIPVDSSPGGWFGRPMDTNYLAMYARDWHRIGLANEQFKSPSGGFLSLDLFKQSAELPGAQYIALVGESTFHQIHGGIASNTNHDELLVNFPRWRNEYLAVKGEDYVSPVVRPLLWGKMHEHIYAHMEKLLSTAQENNFECRYRHYWRILSSALEARKFKSHS